MSMNAAHQLNTMVLMFAGQLAASESYSTLIGLGFRKDQIPKLQELNFMDISDMATALSGSVVQARVDATAVDVMFQIIHRRRSDKQRIEQLIRAGASHRLMAELHGMEASLFAAYRHKLGIKGMGNGRPTLPDRSVVDEIWKALLSGDGDPGARYLQVHEATGQSLKTIEQVVRGAETQATEGGAEGKHNKTTDTKEAVRHGDF